MGMSIDEAIEHGKEQLEIFGGTHKEFIETSLETMRKYQKFQDQSLSLYMERLKADMVAILEDLKQDFIAEAYGIEMDCTDYVVNVADIDKVIQQKINALKEDGSEDE